LIEEGKTENDDMECRSLHAELDYSKKDAVRHIVKPMANGSSDTLRQKLLKNLDCVKKNKPLAQSEIRSNIQSIRSRFS